jgi:hypothetical protein
LFPDALGIRAVTGGRDVCVVMEGDVDLVKGVGEVIRLGGRVGEVRVEDGRGFDTF